MKAMETSQMVAIPADVLNEFPQTKMAPNPVSPVNMLSVSNGTATIPTTNGVAVEDETEKSSIENGENGISQPNVGVKRKDDGAITKDSSAPDLKKIRLFKDSDDDDDPDDPPSQINGKSPDNELTEELEKRLESIPEKSKEMETAQTEAINVLAEVTETLEVVTEALKPKEEEVTIKEDTDKEDTDKEDVIKKDGIKKDGILKDSIKEDSECKKEEAKMKSKLRRLSRRELENMILKRLNEKILNQHEMGKLKNLSEKLEATLENNRKKTAQFHKEIEDMKKVTQKLMQDHLARKGQYVAPIRIKRSVGIQATDAIIKKGAMYTSNGSGPYKTIAPRPGVSKGTPLPIQPITPTTAALQTQLVRGATSATPVQTVKATTTSGTTQMLMVPAGQMVSVPKSVVTATVNGSITNSGRGFLPMASSRLIGNPLVSPQGSLIRAGQQQVVIQQSGSTTASALAAVTTTPAAKTNGTGGFIDLTDDDESARARTAGTLTTTPSTVVKVPVSGTSGTSLQPAILLIQQPAANGVPRTSAVLVSTVGTTPTTGLTTTLVGANRVASTSSTVSKPTTTATVATTTTQVGPRHPAPLPRTPPQQQSGGMRSLPPQPTLKLSHKENSIVLSWTMTKTEEHEAIASYQLYAYQEGTATPSSDLWKKVGSVKALELPMACTLTQFMPGHVYHFAVRAVDSRSRLGPFSEPRSIRLDR